MTGDTAAEYYQRAMLDWARARENTGRPIDRHFRVAGLSLRLRFAGPRLLPAYVSALVHLEAEAPRSTPDLTVHLWECVSAGLEMPAAPVALESFTLRGELRDFSDGRRFAAYDPVGRTIFLYDALRATALVCVYDVQFVASYERAAPLRSVFGWLMRAHGRQLVHAAGIGTSAGGVLIIGRSGSGKSNTAVGSMLAGLDYAGDDFCAVSIAPDPIVHSLYCAAKLRPGDWACPQIEPSNPEDPPAEKRIYFLHPHHADRLKPEIPVRAILLPQRTAGDRPNFVPISPRIALIEMASQSLAMLPNAGAEAVSIISAFVRRVPCYRLDLGSRPERVPAAIVETIQSLAQSGERAGAGR